MLSQELIDTYSHMVDPRLGIIRRVAEVPLQPGEPPLFVLAANCARPKYFLRNAPFPVRDADYSVPANGVALNREQALWCVLGEACERYSAGLYREADLVTASREELGDSALPVESLIGFSERQLSSAGFPFVRFDRRAQIRWAWGTNLTRKRSSLVPATLVYLGYAAISSQEAFYPTLSTGMAAGRTLAQALLNGLCEVVERDAFMATWLLRKPPQRVPFEALHEVLTSNELLLVTNPSVEVSVSLMSTDISMHSAITVVRPRGRSAAVVGSAAHPSLRRAVLRSLLEAYHTLNWSIYLERTPRASSDAPLREFEDHVRYYLDERRFPEIVWLTHGSERNVGETTRLRSDDYAAYLAGAQRVVEDAGYDVHFVETTTRDIQSLGFRTVRVIVPGLHPLNVGSGTVHEDDRRLRKVARHWGITMPSTLNPHPHPFP